MDTKSLAPGIIEYCKLRWSPGEVVRGFTNLCDPESEGSGIVPELAMLLEGIVLGTDKGLYALDGEVIAWRDELAQDCLNEVQRTTLARAIIVQEAQVGAVGRAVGTGKTELGRHNNGTAALISLVGRKINEVEWEGLNLIVWVAPRG